MNTSKYNIDQQIKLQIEEREITATRDLWTEIESQTLAPTSGKTKINWFLVAACLGLLISLGLVLVNNNEEVDAPQLVETAVQKESTPPKKNLENESTTLLVERSGSALQKINPEITAHQAKISDPEVIVVKNQIPSIKEKQIIPEITQNQLSNSVVVMDSSKISVKRKRFVDPSTLLFSVEHKDVIEKSKDGSNVATIDLNSK